MLSTDVCFDSGSNVSMSGKVYLSVARVPYTFYWCRCFRLGVSPEFHHERALFPRHIQVTRK